MRTTAAVGRCGVASLLVVALGLSLVALVGPGTADARTQAPRFTDTAGSVFSDDVAWIAERGITIGCADGRFCPSQSVTRGQLARFLVRALDLTEVSGRRFSDVAGDASLVRDVDRLATAGITLGCGADRFCPSDPVTRDQMASLLARALELRAAAGLHFRDVSRDSSHAPGIDRLATAGIANGCRDDLYCPRRAVTRGQMAAFLRRALDTEAGGSNGAGGAGTSPPPAEPGRPTPPPTEPGQPAPPPTEPTPPDSDGWELYWSDEFDGADISPVWRRYHNTYGDGNRELQCYTPNNVSLENGALQLTARREAVRCPVGTNLDRQFTSGFLGTRDTGAYFPKFARYEMRARLPHGQGMWPGFWLRHRQGASTAEVDIMEYFHSAIPGQTTTTLHLDGRTNVSKQNSFFESPTTSPGWHTWAVEIDPVATGVRFRFLLNDEVVHTYVDEVASWASKAPVEETWDIAVNLSVGGLWTGHPDDNLGELGLLGQCSIWRYRDQFPSCPDAGIHRAQFPVTYEIDYVRVWTRG